MSAQCLGCSVICCAWHMCEACSNPNDPRKACCAKPTEHQAAQHESCCCAAELNLAFISGLGYMQQYILAIHCQCIDVLHRLVVSHARLLCTVTSAPMMQTIHCTDQSSAMQTIIPAVGAVQSLFPCCASMRAALQVLQLAALCPGAQQKS